MPLEVVSDAYPSLLLGMDILSSICASQAVSWCINVLQYHQCFLFRILFILISIISYFFDLSFICLNSKAFQAVPKSCDLAKNQTPQIGPNDLLALIDIDPQYMLTRPHYSLQITGLSRRRTAFDSPRVRAPRL